MHVSIHRLRTLSSIILHFLLQLLFFFFFYCYVDHRDLHSFPTRRSSDLSSVPRSTPALIEINLYVLRRPSRRDNIQPAVTIEDRKSTRLNSSHSSISYAVFCLKKKKKTFTLPNITIAVFNYYYAYTSYID